MKINKLYNISFKNKIYIQKNKTINNKLVEIKPAITLFASLIALATLGKTNITISTQHSKNNTFITELKTPNKIEETKENRLFKTLTNLLNGKESDGSDTGIFESFFNNKDIEASEIIKITPIEKLIPHIRKNTELYAENGLSSHIIINKLIEHRLKTMSKNYIPNKNFISQSNLFKEYIDDEGYIQNGTSTKQYYIKYDFCKKIKQICQNKKQKEQFANDFIIMAFNKKNISLYNQNLSKTDIDLAIIELLLPDESIKEEPSLN